MSKKENKEKKLDEEDNDEEFDLVFLRILKEFEEDEKTL